MNTECESCGVHYTLRDGCEPAPFCDPCAQKKVEELSEIYESTNTELHVEQRLNSMLRAEIRALHRRVGDANRGAERNARALWITQDRVNEAHREIERLKGELK